MSIVWIAMLDGDTETAAREAAGEFDDARVRRFFDPRKRVGHAFAPVLGLGWEGAIAWDVYLFYPPGAQWDEKIPPPISWMHQLSDARAPAAHRQLGNQLIEALRATMEQVSGGRV